MTVPKIPTELDKIQQALSKYDEPMAAKERPVWINNLLYGQYGVGKTKVACECGENPYLFAIDSGWTTLKDWPELSEKVTVGECQGIAHYEIFVKALVAGAPLYEQFDHIIIDPWSKLIDERLDWQLLNLAPSKQGENRTNFSVKPDGPDRANAKPEASAGWSDYQLVRNWARRFVYPLFRLPKHITLVCHVRDPGFSDDRSIRASVPGKTHEMVAREVDLISYMIQEGDNRTISFHPGKNIDGKSRYRNLHGKSIKAEQLPDIYRKYGA